MDLKLRALTAILMLWPNLALGQAVAVKSQPDPYVLSLNNGELTGAFGFTNTSGKTLKSAVFPNAATTTVIITTGQSNIASFGSGVYTTSSANAWNFNIYDGGIYGCSNSVLGTGYATTTSNSANCQVADQLITAATYTHVIMVPIAVAGTVCSQWTSGGNVYNRIVVAMARLASAGLTKATGFLGDVWIVASTGEADNQQGTPRVTLATCYDNWAKAFTDNGSGNTRFFLPQYESMVGNVTSPTVQGAQQDAITAATHNIRAGNNLDSLTGVINRQADGTHLAQAGVTNQATQIVNVITNCKNTSC